MAHEQGGRAYPRAEYKPWRTNGRASVLREGSDPTDPNDTPQMPLTGAWGLAVLAVVLAIAGAVRRFRRFPSAAR